MIVLVGFMGAGKSTVGPLLADALGLSFVDVDRAIETSEGSSIPEIFTSYGEARFRTLETAAVEKALSAPNGVVALGGGALGDPATCTALEWHTVIHLDVSYPEAMHRVGKDPGRPMLAIDDPRALYDSRRATYERVARFSVSTDGLTPAEVVTLILKRGGLMPSETTRSIEVALGDRSYEVHVGANIAPALAGYVDVPHGAKLFVITHPGLIESAKPVVDSLSEAGEVIVLTVDEGEESKTLEGAGHLFAGLADHGAHRGDMIVSFGGGVVSDLAGFVASTWHRGVPVVHIPTTLLGQVDAAIGGKTAVNLPHGKNLVGTIHQPRAVVCDVALLRSLPDEELRAGMAEVIKAALIADPRLADLILEKIDGVIQRDESVLEEIVRRSAAIKAAIVSADEHETGGREILNYGHTFGHALEHTTALRHGEAIAVGMMAAAHLAHDLGMLGAEEVELHSSLLDATGLPRAARFELDVVVAALAHDKKHRGTMRFVLLNAIGSARRGIQAHRDQVAHALRRVSL